MASLQPIRGTHDYLPEESAKHRIVIETVRSLAERYGFGQIQTPIFESTNVFKRTLGDTSDVVTKEMYTFDDRSGESLTLRPEGTAGVARALISGGLTQNLPLKLFYHGPMFRYERPQKGRLRQFHQVGVELLGVGEPQGDIEVIAMGAQVLDALGVGDKCVLQLNSLGDTESRDAYRKILVEFLLDHKDKLSEDSLNRLDKNPLRVLDSKDKGDQAIVVDAPRLSEHLNQESQDFFGAVKQGLDKLGIAYNLNDALVRGLDYYSHTAFEFTTDALGAQGTVLAGGRYDGLVGQMGGPATAGVGWAAGIERLVLLADPAIDQPVTFAIVPVGGEAQLDAMKIADDLRKAGLAVEMGYRGNLRKRMTQAGKRGARAAVMMGTDELAKGVVTVKDFQAGEQVEVALDGLIDYLKGL